MVQERAREDAEDNASPEMDTGDGEEGAESEGEEDGLRSEALRWKGMDVGSMDALKKRIEVKIFVLEE